MPQGGRLSISLDNVEIVGSTPTGGSQGRYVRLSIKDEGEGIPRELQSKIFDPFFTTKDPGKGTGLGLSTAFSIVHEHGGFIAVESVLGQGSEFVIHLPAVANSQEVEPESEHSVAGEGNDRMVLLVDDERSIRHVARRALERNGYHVLEAADGIEALALYNTHRDNISLVVTDMSMPQMTGSELAGCLKNLDPELVI